MSKLSKKEQGVRGGTPSWKEKCGYVKLWVDNHEDSICIDAFSGLGDQYKERDTCLINIEKDGNICFSGSFDELVSIIIKSNES